VHRATAVVVVDHPPDAALFQRFAHALYTAHCRSIVGSRIDTELDQHLRAFGLLSLPAGDFFDLALDVAEAQFLT
jgi:hypothetical protein